MTTRRRDLPASDDAPHPADWKARDIGNVLPRKQGYLMWWAALRLCTRREDPGTQALRAARTWYEAQPIAEGLMADAIAEGKAQPVGRGEEVPF